jgi:Ni2+-binding GTPase involved in maturation of urease and hydrogenase
MVRRCASTRSGRTLARTGTPLKQIARGGTCHLDAPTIARALARRALATIDLLFVETVGNLPTSFDLGEDMKIVLLSVNIGYAAVSGCFRMPR